MARLSILSNLPSPPLPQWVIGPTTRNHGMSLYFILPPLPSPSGLQDQLLGIVVAEERPDLEDSKNQLIVSNAQMKQELKEIEDKILHLLSASQGSPVDDIELIETLDASKITSGEIQVGPYRKKLYCDQCLTRQHCRQYRAHIEIRRLLGNT